MVRNTTRDATERENELVGKHIFNKSTYTGLGVIVDVKTVRNGHGDERRVFVTKNAPDADTVYRDVDAVFQRLDGDAWSTEAYDVGEVFDDYTPEDFGL